MLVVLRICGFRGRHAIPIRKLFVDAVCVSMQNESIESRKAWVVVNLAAHTFHWFSDIAWTYKATAASKLTTPLWLGTLTLLIKERNFDQFLKVIVRQHSSQTNSIRLAFRIWAGEDKNYERIVNTCCPRRWPKARGWSRMMKGREGISPVSNRLSRCRTYNRSICTRCFTWKCMLRKGALSHNSRLEFLTETCLFVYTRLYYARGKRKPF